ncbi:DUF3459 domain-containing protein, partial [Kitasatospora purpeofusca]|uniref:DUF3459 domain-containing protein n=1 Tax=Kitasatospora purpeofusca TaxID=67352 RepID=UPI0033C7994A
SGAEAPYGFGPDAGGPSWLPQPAEWAALSVEAQTGDPTSTLELYRSALALRRDTADLGAGREVEWLESPAGTLAFRRGSFVCTVNTTGAPARIPAPGRLLLTSAEAAETDGDEVVLFPDCTDWWAV